MNAHHYHCTSTCRLILQNVIFCILLVGCGGAIELGTPSGVSSSALSKGAVSSSSSLQGNASVSSANSAVSSSPISSATSIASSSAAQEDCAQLRATFAARVWPLLVDGSCTACHSPSGPASGTALILSAAKDAESNYQAVYKLLNLSTKNGAALFIDKPTGVVPHFGDTVFEPNSPEAATLKAFRDKAVNAPYCAQPLVSSAPSLTLMQFTSEDTLTYLRMLAPRLIDRQLLPSEVTRIQTEGSQALEPVLKGWLQGASGANSARRFIDTLLNTSGHKGDANFNLPGNLAAYVVAKNKPWAEVLTANYCVNDEGAPTTCDTGAPYTAGVLTTRGFLVNNHGRFNLRPSSTLLNAFSCKRYPVPDALEPRIERTRLIPMFAAEKSEVQFGNGTECYTCHGQFAPHAQLFVKFDEAGHWQANATGVQDPNGELGRSTKGLMASHLVNPTEAALENSQMQGKPVANLAEAAKVISQSDVYKSCTVKSLVMHTFGLDRAVAMGMDDDFTHLLVNKIHQANPQPTFQNYLLGILTDLNFINTYVMQLSAVADGEFPKISIKTEGAQTGVTIITPAMTSTYYAARIQGGPGAEGCSSACSDQPDRIHLSSDGQFTWGDVYRGKEGLAELYLKVAVPSPSNRAMSLWVNGVKVGTVGSRRTTDTEYGPFLAQMNQGVNQVQLRSSENTPALDIVHLRLADAASGASMATVNLSNSYTFKNAWKGGFITAAGDASYMRPNAEPDGLSHWRYEPVTAEWGLLRNVANPNIALHIEYGQLEAGVVDPGWVSAQWKLYRTQHNGASVVRIPNRWKPELHLHYEFGVLASGPISDQWSSAHWSTQSF